MVGVLAAGRETRAMLCAACSLVVILSRSNASSPFLNVLLAEEATSNLQFVFCCAQVQQTLTVVVRQGTVPSKLMISSYPTSLMQPNCTLKSPDCCYRNLFLPCDAMRKRGTIRRQVSLSVRHTRLLHQSGYRQAYHRTLWPDSLITLVS